MACTERWVDVFVTRPDAGYTVDDQFACSVQSVVIHNDESQTPTEVRAFITTQDSDWILPTWTDNYDGAGSYSVFNSIEVGSLVRIGETPTKGHTDYLTVVDRVQVDKLYNYTGGSVIIKMDGTTTLANEDSKTFDKNGIAHYALRLNMSLNATTMPSGVITDATLAKSDQTNADLTNRNAATIPRFDKDGKPVPSSTAPIDERFYYPLYVQRPWVDDRTLFAQLDHGVKQVSCIKLVGYSMHNKRQVGLQHAHEFTTDDFVIVRIKEIEGHVISNNAYANGAFAVLYCGSTADNEVGAIEYSRFDTVNAIVTQHLDASNAVLRNLTLEVTDRVGKAANFGRMHLWFKLLVTHG